MHQFELLLARMRPDVADAGHGPLEGGRAEVRQVPHRPDLPGRLRLAPHPPDVLPGRQVGVYLDKDEVVSQSEALVCRSVHSA